MASEIVSQGRAAWGRLKQGSRSWEDWKIVGAALLEGRVVAMRDARAWHPIGRAYSSALDSWPAQCAAVKQGRPVYADGHVARGRSLARDVDRDAAAAAQQTSLGTHCLPASDRDQARAGARHRAVGVTGGD